MVLKSAVERQNEDDVEVLEDVLSSCLVSQQILDNMLTYERFESENIKMFPRQVAVRALVQDVFSVFEVEVSILRFDACMNHFFIVL